MAATVAAKAVDDIGVPEQGEPFLTGGFLLEAFEIGVLDGDLLAAPFTDHLAALISHGLVAGDAVCLVDAAGYARAVKVFDRSVYGRSADVFVHIVHFTEQFLRADRSLFTHEYLEDQ